jgi:hypothetical protein
MAICRDACTVDHSTDEWPLDRGAAAARGVKDQLTHNPRASILSVSAFFLAGIVLLARVDVQAGARAAAEEESAIEAARAAD